jgi:hypothetical protein
VDVGGSAATFIPGTFTNEANVVVCYVYGLVTGNTTGNQTVTVGWGGGNDLAAGAAAHAFGGVDQTTPYDGWTAENYAFGVTTLSRTIASEEGDMTVDWAATNNNTAHSGATQTQVLGFNPTSDGLTISSSIADGAASNAHGWTLTGSARSVQAGLNLNATP